MKASELYGPTVHEQDDLGNVHVSCSCGEWEFRGDWDDMCDEWFVHEADPSYTHLYVTRNDHKGHTFLSRAGGEKLLEIMKRGRQPLPAEPLEIDES